MSREETIADFIVAELFTKLNIMNWTEPKSPTKGVSPYDHTDCESPLGLIRIEWKSWKENPSYGIEVDGKYVGTEYDLETAKYVAQEYLIIKHRELSELLGL